MSIHQDNEQWIAYDVSRDGYVTRDGTFVAAVLINSANCLADVLHIACIRQKQREAMKQAKEVQPQ